MMEKQSVVLDHRIKRTVCNDYIRHGTNICSAELIPIVIFVKYLIKRSDASFMFILRLLRKLWLRYNALLLLNICIKFCFI